MHHLFHPGKHTHTCMEPTCPKRKGVGKKKITTTSSQATKPLISLDETETDWLRHARHENPSCMCSDEIYDRPLTDFRYALQNPIPLRTKRVRPRRMRTGL